MGIRTLSIVHQIVKNHQEFVLIHMIVIEIILKLVMKDYVNR